MFRPNIAPRRVMGTAAAGLFSAARSSIRRVENVTNKISKAPDVTKEQKFGINYVGFFGSKKNVKILKKSLKSIRDSLVATFEIAKLLRSEVSKNAKLIGGKTRGKKGIFGIGLGGILSLISILTNPIILSVLGIAGAGIAGGFLIKFLYDNRDKIIGFIMDKARGLYDFLQSFVSNIVRDFIGDRVKSPELRNLEFRSEERIEENMDKLVKEQGMTEGDARIEATNLEIKFLKEEQQKLDLSTNPRTSRANKPGDLKKFEALDARIKELQTGEVTTDRLSGIMERFFGESIRDTLRREAVFLPESVTFSDKSQEEQLELTEKIFRKFKQQGNDPSRVKQLYQREIEKGLSADKEAQARAMIAFAEKEERSKVKEKDTSSEVNNEIKPSSTKKSVTNRNADRNSSESSSNNAGKPGSVGFNPNISGGSGLTQQPVAANSAPEMVIHNNFDPDNQYRDMNASLLNIFP
tara:strand:- start:1177 stop:2577 length:1401 start_codon:yes stop_codon:yes gene_type:complete